MTEHEYHAPRIMHIFQQDGSMHDIDWDAVTDAVVGPNPGAMVSPSLRIHFREGLKDALIEATARFYLGDEEYEKMRADMHPKGHTMTGPGL